MARKLIRKYIPKPHQIQNNRWLAFFGKYIANPNLWHLHRRSVAKAFSIGLFITFIPLPGHTLLAALSAILFRANLPLSIALSWFVNPLTIIPFFGLAYSIGAYLMGIPLSDFHFEWSLIKSIWPPLCLGCLICGITLAMIGNIGIRLYWRYIVVKAWKLRQLKQNLLTTALDLPLNTPADPFDSQA